MNIEWSIYREAGVVAYSGYDANPIYFIQLDKIDANNKENPRTKKNSRERKVKKKTTMYQIIVSSWSASHRAPLSSIVVIICDFLL